MQRILLAALPLTLLLPACDREPAAEIDAASRAADDFDDDAPDEAAPRGHERGGKLAHRVQRLCDALACSDEQRTEIEALLAARPRPDRGERDRAGHQAAMQALAEAFRGDAFAAADLATFHDAVGRDHEGPPEGLTQLAIDLHALLTPEQRQTLGTKIAERGAFFLGGRGHGGPDGFGRHGKHGKHGKRFRGGPDDVTADADRPDAGDRATHRATKICDALSCTDAQREQVTAALAKLNAGEDDPTARRALGDAFAGDGFGAGDVDAFFTAMAAEHDARRQTLDEVIVELHGVLTAEQRATLAERIEHAGPRAIVGGRGGKRGRHGKKRRHRRRRPAGEQDGPTELGLG